MEIKDIYNGCKVKYSTFTCLSHWNVFDSFLKRYPRIW